MFLRNSFIPNTNGIFNLDILFPNMTYIDQNVTTVEEDDPIYWCTCNSQNVLEQGENFNFINIPW